MSFQRLKKQARENLNSDKGKELRKRRGNEVESVFGDQKLNKLKRRYHLRGMPKVKLEAGMYYVAHNIRKIHKINQIKSLKSRKYTLDKQEELLIVSESLNSFWGGLAF